MDTMEEREIFLYQMEFSSSPLFITGGRGIISSQSNCPDKITPNDNTNNIVGGRGQIFVLVIDF